MLIRRSQRQVRDTSASTGSSSYSGLWRCAGVESPADPAEISGHFLHSLDYKQDEHGRIFPGVILPVDSLTACWKCYSEQHDALKPLCIGNSRLAKDFNTNNYDQICPKLVPQFWDTILRTIICYVHNHSYNICIYAPAPGSPPLPKVWYGMVRLRYGTKSGSPPTRNTESHMTLFHYFIL